jgi:hypothetical protein
MNSEQIERFSRQLLLPGWTMKVQSSCRSQILIIDGTLEGVALYAAAAGIGKLLLVETPRTALVDYLRRFNPETQVKALTLDELMKANFLGNCSAVFCIANSPLAHLLDNPNSAIPQSFQIGENGFVRVETSGTVDNLHFSSPVAFNQNTVSVLALTSYLYALRGV